MKKQSEIVIEITEIIAFENTGQIFEAYCIECSGMVKMTTPKVCSVMKKVSEREIFRLIETKQIHFVETGHILVCLESVKKV